MRIWTKLRNYAGTQVNSITISITNHVYVYRLLSCSFTILIVHSLVDLLIIIENGSLDLCMKHLVHSLVGNVERLYVLPFG